MPLIEDYPVGACGQRMKHFRHRFYSSTTNSVYLCPGTGHRPPWVPRRDPADVPQLRHRVSSEAPLTVD
jgi:hypothetical protein